MIIRWIEVVLVILMPMTVVAKTSNSQIDCSHSNEFVAKDILKADVTVFKHSGDDTGDVEVCSSQKPLEIPILDIQGREAEWFYCYKRDSKLDLTCKASYLGKSAQLLVRPAIVIRSWKPSAALDVHMHVLLIQDHNPNNLRDVFTRSLNFDLTQRAFTIEGRSGDWVSSTDVHDNYEVRVRFYK